MSADRWPTAGLSPVRRLAVLAAALPGAHLEERELGAPFDDVWGYFSDIERSIPEFDETVGRLDITRRDGSQLVARARTAGRFGVGITFDVELSPGWCWMVARPGLYVVGFAADPVGDDGTRLAHLEALQVRGPEWVRHAAAPLFAASRRLTARHVPHDLDAIERAVIP
jgi:hypothetical protein